MEISPKEHTSGPKGRVNWGVWMRGKNPLPTHPNEFLRRL